MLVRRRIPAAAHPRRPAQPLRQRRAPPILLDGFGIGLIIGSAQEVATPDVGQENARRCRGHGQHRPASRWVPRAGHVHLDRRDRARPVPDPPPTATPKPWPPCPAITPIRHRGRDLRRRSDHKPAEHQTRTPTEVPGGNLRDRRRRRAGCGATAAGPTKGMKRAINDLKCSGERTSAIPMCFAASRMQPRARPRPSPWSNFMVSEPY